MPNLVRPARRRRIVAAYAINRLGTWIGTVAVSLAVFDRTHNALAVAATLMAAQVIPAVAVPFLVARVEASSHRRELSLLYGFEALATCVLAFLVSNFSLPAVLLVVALDGTAALAASALLRSEAARAAREDPFGEHGHHAAGDRAAHAVAPTEADRDLAEVRINATINVAFSITFVLGPAIGGLLVGTAGASVALLIDAASFVIAAALLLDLHPHVETAPGESSIRARLRAGWAYINEVAPLRALLMAQAIALIFFESAAPIEVSYAKSTLHAGDRGYGLLMAFWGVGVVVGSLVFARAVRRSLRVMISAGTFAVGAAYVGFALAPTLAAACAVAVVGGVGNGVQWAPLVSAIQHLTRSEFRGRVMGALEAVGALTPAIGLTIGGVLVAVGSPRWAFLAVGIGAMFTTILFARVRVERAPAVADAPPREGATTVSSSRSPRWHTALFDGCIYRATWIRPLSTTGSPACCRPCCPPAACTTPSRACASSRSSAPPR